MATLGDMPKSFCYDLIRIEIGDIFFVEKDPPFGGLQYAGEGEEESGFPRLVGPDEGNYLSFFHLQ
jgi:hypothetical protein